MSVFRRVSGTRSVILSNLVPALLAAIVSIVPVQSAVGQTIDVRVLDIPTRDGITLHATIVAPATPGPHPAIIFPASWGGPSLEYVFQAQRLARRGYVTVSYTARGLYLSGGEADVAGPRDIADVSDVIDWTIAHTATDPARIGMGGISYGGLISLIAAAHDSRIKAVAAMSVAADLVDAFYTNQTRRVQVVTLLELVGNVIGRLSVESAARFLDYRLNRNIPVMSDWGRVRSPATYVASINANRPAILLANAYGDSLFPPNQLVEFYNALATPKRLRLAPGDHATVEIPGLFGLPADVWTDVHRWFDAHLAGTDPSISTENPVVLTTHDRRVESYPSWEQSATRVQTFSLGHTARIRSGIDTFATAGLLFVSNAIDQLLGIPPLVWVPAVSRFDAVVWQGPLLGSPQRIRGMPQLDLTATPSAATGTLVIYLYDVNLFGTGRLITQIPYTYSNVTPGAPIALNIALNAAAYDVPAGHRLAVIVDTKDPLYGDLNQPGSSVVVSLASLDLPVR